MSGEEPEACVCCGRHCDLGVAGSDETTWLRRVVVKGRRGIRGWIKLIIIGTCILTAPEYLWVP